MPAVPANTAKVNIHKNSLSNTMATYFQSSLTWTPANKHNIMIGQQIIYLATGNSRVDETSEVRRAVWKTTTLSSSGSRKIVRTCMLWFYYYLVVGSGQKRRANGFQSFSNVYVSALQNTILSNINRRRLQHFPPRDIVFSVSDVAEMSVSMSSSEDVVYNRSNNNPGQWFECFTRVYCKGRKCLYFGRVVRYFRVLCYEPDAETRFVHGWRARWMQKSGASQKNRALAAVGRHFGDGNLIGHQALRRTVYPTATAVTVTVCHKTVDDCKWAW